MTIGETVTEKEGTTMNKLGIPWKSILGFLTVFAGQLLARATVDGVPVLPENVSGWMALVGGSFGAAGLIWLKGNVYTLPQAEAKVAEARGRHARPDDMPPPDWPTHDPNRRPVV